MSETTSQPIASLAPLPAHETARLEALRRYNILDTPPEVAFDRITSLAARLFKVPTVLVSLMDESRAWFKSCYGFNQQEVPREVTICSFAMLYDDVLVVPDARQDDRFASNPFVQGEPGLRFYAGAPLLTSDGLNIGTLCLLDSKPRNIFTEEQKANLKDLAAMVMDELELRLAARKIAQIDAALMEVAQGVSGVTGQAFFQALVQHLTKALDVNYACISLLAHENPETVKTLAFYAQGKIIDNVEYELQGTPCLEVIRQQKLACYASNIQTLFPNDSFLISLGLESYASIPFFDSQGKLLGLLGVMDTKPMENVQLVASLLTLFAMRIAAELERHQAEEMRQAAAQRLQLYADVVQNAQVGLVVWQLEDPNDPGSFRLVLANPAASEATGFDFEPVVGKTMAESFPRLLQTPLIHQYLEVVRTGSSMDLGEVSYDEDGISIGMYSLKAFPLPDNYCGLAFENITARKQIEAKLETSQRYSQQIAEAMPGVLFVHDIIQQQNIYTNRQITDLLGYTSEQVQAMGADAISTLLHPEDQERVVTYLEAFNTISDNEVLGIEYRAHHASGEWRWLYTQSVVFNRTAEGLPRQILGVSIDISDRKQSEHALQESEAWARLATQVAQLGGWRLHLDTNLVEIDERMRQIWGEPDDVVMLPLPEVLERIHPDDRERVASAVNAALDPIAPQPYEIEYRLVWNDGTERWVSTKGQARFEGEGHSRRTLDFFGTALDITRRKRDEAKRKQIEAALQASEERYRHLAEATPQIVWTTDASGMATYFNPYWYRYTGISEVESLGFESPNALHPDDRDRVFQKWLAAVDAGESYDIEIRLRRWDGVYRWFLCRGLPIRNTTGAIVGWVGTDTDIDDQKHIQEALRQSEERLSLALNAAKQGLYDLNVQTGDAIVSPEYARMLGYEPEEFQETNIKWRDRLHPDDIATAYRVYEEYIAGIHPEYRAEFRQRTQQGDWIWIFSIGKIVTWDQDGKPLRMLGTHTDISDRKRAEQALQEHSEQLNLLYETTRDLLSAQHPLELMNRLFDRLSVQMDLDYYYQFQLTQQKGQPHLRLMNYSGLSEEQAQEFESIELGQAMCGLVAQERRQIVFNQAEIAAHPNAQAIYSMGVSAYAGQPLMVQGRLLGTLSFGSLTRTQFTTEEAHLLQAISEQVAIALDRAELVTSLQQQTEDLAQANRVKDEFLAVLSHELRSPLNPILGWTKLLQTGKFDAQRTKQALEVIERNAKQQTQLIDDLLDISKILRGKLVLSEAPVELALIIEAALETVRLAAEAKSIQIKTDFDSFLPPILGDGGRLQQVVVNLLSNAIKFTPTGGQIKVSLKQVGSEAQIQVEDTGRGITPDFLPYVFESFRQEDGKTTRKFGGLGLGLAIVRQLTELHGGSVRAQSLGEGTGATFTICLPLMKTLSLGFDDSPQVEAPFSQVDVLKSIRVLVVDDEADMRDLVVTILEQAGAIIQTAVSAIDALTIFEQFQPALLISDIGMPDMDGYTLMQQLRALPLERGGKIPAVALTAYASEFDQQQAFQAGFQKHVSKPVEPEELIRTIVDLLEPVAI